MAHSTLRERGRTGASTSVTRIAGRSYLAGGLQNTPANMGRWIQQPPHVKKGTVMPEMGVSENDARDTAAYLYTLR